MRSEADAGMSPGGKTHLGQQAQVGRRAAPVGAQRNRDAGGEHLFQRVRASVRTSRASAGSRPPPSARPCPEEGDLLVIQIVAVDHQRPMRRRQSCRYSSARVPGEWPSRPTPRFPPKTCAAGRSHPAATRSPHAIRPGAWPTELARRPTARRGGRVGMNAERRVRTEAEVTVEGVKGVKVGFCEIPTRRRFVRGSGQSIPERS